MRLFTFPDPLLTFQRNAKAAIEYSGGTQPMARITLADTLPIGSQIQFQGIRDTTGAMWITVPGASASVDAGQGAFDVTLTTTAEGNVLNLFVTTNQSGSVTQLTVDQL